MSMQRKEILAVMSSDAAWSWSYAQLKQALPDIAPNVIRAQVSRMVRDGIVTRDDNGLLRVTSATGEQHALQASATPTDTARNASNADASATPTDAPEAREHTDVARNTRPLGEHEAYARVLDALPVAPMRAAMRVATALAFTRSTLEGCQAPALAICGRSGTGKSNLLKALCVLLHGDISDVTDGDNLTTKPGVIGRREKVDGRYVAVPSVLLEPPDRPRPKLIVIDEAANAETPALKGLRTMLKLEDAYILEGIPMPVRAAVTMTWNKPDGVTGYWHPFGSWEGSTRRMLICDLDYAADNGELSELIVTRSARHIFAAVEHPNPIDFAAYRDKVRYPSTALLETADDIKADVFVRAANHPVGDPALRGLTASYAVLFGHTLEHALLLSLADVATVVGTSHGMLKPDAEKKLNARLKSAGLAPVALPRLGEMSSSTEPGEMTLSPQARARIGEHLARSSVKGTDELLTILAEYGLAGRQWRPVRAPRYGLEFLARWFGAFGFAVLGVLYNLIAPVLKFPTLSGSPIRQAFAFAWRGPRTRLREWTTPDGRPLDRPRAYILEMFGEDMKPRDAIAVEDVELADVA